jgi:hypothetical protein
LPDPTVAELSGQGCPFWLVPWDSTGAALKTVRAARTIAMCTLFMNVFSLIEESLGPTRQEHNLFVVTDLFHDGVLILLAGFQSEQY